MVRGLERSRAATHRFTLIGGNAGEMTAGAIVLHLVNHTSYHRGFVADLFYQVPARPPLTDLPVYLREAGRQAAGTQQPTPPGTNP